MSHKYQLIVILLKKKKTHINYMVPLDCYFERSPHTRV